MITETVSAMKARFYQDNLAFEYALINNKPALHEFYDSLIPSHIDGLNDGHVILLTSGQVKQIEERLKALSKMSKGGKEENEITILGQEQHGCTLWIAILLFTASILTAAVTICYLTNKS